MPAPRDVSHLMPAARRLALADGKIPSARQLAKDLRVDWYVGRDVRDRLIEEDPLAPVSPGAPEYDPLTEATGAFPVLAAPLAPEATAKATGKRQVLRTVALIVPLLLVNSAAIYGQQGWAYDHIGHDRAVALMFAAAVESIGVYLAAEAHAALMAGDASARLRLGSYLVGLLVGALNYAHFSGPGYQVNPLALTFGLLSSISPMLWAIRSRSMNRDRLRELGLIDPRAVRFSLLRWLLFPIRCWFAFRNAVWEGIVQPAEAVTAADLRRKK